MNWFKGIVHQKKKTFTHPQVVPNLDIFLQENKTNLLRKLFFQCIYQVCVRFIIISFITDSPFSTLSYYRNSSAIRFRNTTGLINNALLKINELRMREGRNEWVGEWQSGNAWRNEGTMERGKVDIIMGQNKMVVLQ